MSLSIPVPTSPWSDVEVTLGGASYKFTYSFNERDSRWRLAISKQGVVLISGVKLVEGQYLLGRYLLDDFKHGDLKVFKFKNEDGDIGRHNLGSGLSYELTYLTNEEIENLK